MFCPKCKIEHEDEVKGCPDCGELLNYELEQESFEDNEPVLLAKGVDSLNCHVICDLLKQNSIPTAKKYENAGGLLTNVYGMHNQAAEIYVPRAAFEKAVELVGEFIE